MVKYDHPKRIVNQFKLSSYISKLFPSEDDAENCILLFQQCLGKIALQQARALVNTQSTKIASRNKCERAGVETK